MPRSDTNQNSFQLKPKQQAALEGLLAGLTVTAAAKAARVGRETLHRWLREDFQFQAAHARQQREVSEAASQRISGLATDAVGTVADAIASGDVQASLAILKGLGLLPQSRAIYGSEDPVELERGSNLAALERENRQRSREGIAALDKLWAPLDVP